MGLINSTARYICVLWINGRMARMSIETTLTINDWVQFGSCGQFIFIFQLTSSSKFINLLLLSKFSFHTARVLVLRKKKIDKQPLWRGVNAFRVREWPATWYTLFIASSRHHYRCGLVCRFDICSRSSPYIFETCTLNINSIWIWRDFIASICVMTVFKCVSPDARCSSNAKT